MFWFVTQFCSFWITGGRKARLLLLITVLLFLKMIKLMSMQRIMETFIMVESSRRRGSRRINHPNYQVNGISLVPWEVMKKVMTQLSLHPMWRGIYVASIYFHHHDDIEVLEFGPSVLLQNCAYIFAYACLHVFL